MSGAPRWKVYTPDGTYTAACKQVRDALVVAIANGPGSQVRDGHARKDAVWIEGIDGFAADSLQAALEHVDKRVDECRQAWARHREKTAGDPPFSRTFLLPRSLGSGHHESDYWLQPLDKYGREDGDRIGPFKTRQEAREAARARL